MAKEKRRNGFEEVLMDIPDGIPNLQLPDPTLLSYYQNLDSRIIWINDSIDEGVFGIVDQILRFNLMDKDIPVEDRIPIKILIYSYGGDGNAAFSLIDAIAMSETPVYTYNMGIAMSAGLVIFLAGHKRFCTKFSTALIHSGSGGTSGTFESTESQMKDYKHFVQTMREYIMNQTNIDLKLMNKKKSQEWFIYAEEQVSLGISNKIIEGIRDIID